MSGQQPSLSTPSQSSDSGQNHSDNLITILIMATLGIGLLILLSVVYILYHMVKHKRRQALRQLDLRVHRLHIQRSHRLSSSTTNIHTTTTTTDIRRTQSVPNLQIPQYLDILPSTTVTLKATFRQSKRYSETSEWDYVNQFDGPPLAYMSTSSCPPPSPPHLTPRSPSPPPLPHAGCTPNPPPSILSSYNSSMPPSLFFSPLHFGKRPLPMATSGWSLDS